MVETSQAQSFVLSDGMDLTPLFTFLTAENAKLRMEVESPDDIPEDEQDEFVLEHIDLLPPEFAEQVKSLLIPALSRPKEGEKASIATVVPVTYPFDEAEESGNVEFSDTGEVVAMSLNKLVERVTERSESELAQVLLSTFPLYTTADCLLDLIFKRLQVPIPKLMTRTERKSFVEQKLRSYHTLITALVKQWIKLWPNSFRIGTHLFNQLAELFPANKDYSVEANSRILAKQLSKVQEQDQGLDVFAEERVPPAPLLPRELDFKANPLLIWCADELARQLTLVDFRYLCKVQIPECLGSRWEHDPESNTPNIKRLSDRFGSCRALFISALISEPDLPNRIRITTKLLDIAACCLDKYYDYETPFIISGVFFSNSVRKLEKTMREVLKQQNSKNIYDRLLLLYQACDFKILKENMEKNCVVPCWLALRQELGKIDKLFPDVVQNGLINVWKHRLTSNIIIKIREYQSKDLCFHKIALCYHYLKAKHFAIDENQYERRAVALEH